MATDAARRGHPLKTRWVMRLRAALTFRRQGGDQRPAAEVLRDIIAHYVERGLVRREGDRLIFKDLDDRSSNADS